MSISIVVVHLDQKQQSVNCFLSFFCLSSRWWHRWIDVDEEESALVRPYWPIEKMSATSASWFMRKPYQQCLWSVLFPALEHFLWTESALFRPYSPFLNVKMRKNSSISPFLLASNAAAHRCFWNIDLALLDGNKGQDLHMIQWREIDRIFPLIDLVIRVSMSSFHLVSTAYSGLTASRETRCWLQDGESLSLVEW